MQIIPIPPKPNSPSHHVRFPEAQQTCSPYGTLHCSFFGVASTPISFYNITLITRIKTHNPRKASNNSVPVIYNNIMLNSYYWFLFFFSFSWENCIKVKAILAELIGFFRSTYFVTLQNSAELHSFYEYLSDSNKAYPENSTTF